MADAEEPQFSSLKERIAALNQQKNFNSSAASPPPTSARKPPPPPPPGRPAAASETRSQTAPITPATAANGVACNANGTRPSVPQRPHKSATASTVPPPLPRRDTQSSQGENPLDQRSAPPPLPSRTPSAQTAPVLPRQTSTQPPTKERRGSTSSEVSQRSTTSTLSQPRTVSSLASQGSEARKLPPAFNQASLPPLPPTKREREAKEQELAASSAATRQKPPLPSVKSAPVVNGSAAASAAHVAKPALPPRLPARPANKTQPAPATQDSGYTQPQVQQLYPLKEAKITGFGSGSKARPFCQAQKQQLKDEPPPPLSTVRGDTSPPPIPTASRPSASQIDAVKARAATGSGIKDDCWTCRDWSAPDGVAAQFPRQSLPRDDPVGHLARGLCDPFPSYTHKARAIFTWFHYNIVYDTASFFGNCVRHMSVEDTIFSGKAVCQGYAETYKAIANRAGLECVVVGGHGKGYGYTPLKKGERPPPPKVEGHAWNAVRIDGGRWKLLDACWGAGHLDSSTNEYKQQFSPKQFTRTNEQFGESHFPKETRYQFRDDGRTVSWEEYFIGRVEGEPPIVYTTAHEEGILESSIEPKERHIPVHSGSVVRFQFSKLCEHWRSETHGKGKPPLLLLSIHGVDGRKDEMVPMETDGYWHWIDVRARDLGAPGQAVQVAYVTKVDGQDARGISAREYLSKKGKVGMAWSYLMKWELV